MKTKIRAMLQADIDSVFTIEKEAHRAPWSREILSDCVLVGYDCQVLEVDDNLIGYIICRSSLDICHVLNLCISKSNQGEGYGTLLLNSVLNSLSLRPKIKSLILEVRPSNIAALALYKKFGFEEDSIKKAYYVEGDHTEDAIVLKKMLG